jgi:hypothetical protein
MFENKPVRRAFPWLEILLAIAIALLILQSIPATTRTLNVTTWSGATWMSVNAGAILLLVIVRLGPDLINELYQRRSCQNARRDVQEKQKELKERRESLEQIKRARKRRLY